jgi:hypothetical protein
VSTKEDHPLLLPSPAYRQAGGRQGRQVLSLNNSTRIKYQSFISTFGGDRVNPS